MAVAVGLGVFLVVGVVEGATTISTNISTGGTLDVTGASTFTGAVNASSTFMVTGAVTTWGSVTLGDAVADSVTANAYFTQMRIGTGSTFGGIGTVGADELGVEGAMEVDGISYLDGNVQFNGYATTTAASGNFATEGDITMGGGDLTVTSSNSATSSIVVGCVETYATSTASPIKQMFFASSTLNIDGAAVAAGFGGGTMQGLVLWGFGSC